MKLLTRIRIGYKNLGLINKIIVLIAIVALVLGAIYFLITLTTGATKSGQKITHKNQEEQKTVLDRIEREIKSKFPQNLDFFKTNLIIISDGGNFNLEEPNKFKITFVLSNIYPKSCTTIPSFSLPYS